MDNDITVSREYFMALLRSAEQAEIHTADSRDAVRVPIEHYQSLQNAAIEFDALKKALVSAGTALESIQILIDATLQTQKFSNDEDVQHKSEACSSQSNSPRWRAWPVQPRSIHYQGWRTGQSEPLTPMTSSEETSFDEDIAQQAYSNNRAFFSTCQKDRSVVLKGLPKYTTLADVTKIVRGGAILNLFIRRTSNTAHVAFVEPEAAERFLRHFNKHDLYIKNKTVKASWDDRQHYMVGSVARRIAHDGATRNLVIHFPKAEVTEDVLRDDLEHIHLLEVVSIDFSDSHAWISLNSIKQAVSAQACMLSRLRYKGSRIDFWPDECAEQLLAPIKVLAQPQQINRKNKASLSSFNRFNILADDDRISGNASDTDGA